MGQVASAVRDADETEIERAVAQLGQSRRWLAPLSYVAGGFGLLLDGVKLLILNWRLTLIEILPAVWIWITFWDLKAHSLRVAPSPSCAVRSPCWWPWWWWPSPSGPTAATRCSPSPSAGDRPPRIRPATAKTRQHWRLIMGWGFGGGHRPCRGHHLRGPPRGGLVHAGAGPGAAGHDDRFVSVPAQIIGIEQTKQPIKAKISAGAASGASARC